MGSKLWYVFRRRLFLLIGLFTYGVFSLGAGHGSYPGVALRVLIIPIWVAWTVVTIAVVAIFGPHPPPGAFRVVIRGIDLAAGLAPYVFADYVLDRWRKAATRKASTNEERPEE